MDFDPALADGLRIAQVEQLTGVGPHTLRAWERRYGVPTPNRTGGKQRMYSRADVELIRRMRALALRGMPLAAAAEKALAEAPERAAAGESTTVALRERMTRALLAFDEAGAAAAWSEATESFDILTVFERVVVPLMREVGLGWHAGTVTVAQEHFATNFVRARLDLLTRQVAPLAGAPTVLLACIEGEHHELGLLMLTVMLRFQGLRTIYLGQDVPGDALIRTSEDTQPEVVALNAGTLDGARRLPAVVSVLREAVPFSAIVYGGGAFEIEPGLRMGDGARYGGPNLTAAVTLINQLGRSARPGGIA